jgi:phosphoribosylanthranilate isomerase
VPRTRIKICGITRVEDALAAANAGADAIGMVFYKRAPRCITISRAKEILAALPAFVTPVGLFVDAPVDEILSVTNELRLRHVQLHGLETPEIVAALRTHVIIKAVRVERATFAREVEAWRVAINSLRLTNFAGLLLETPTTSAGGTGVENDWEFIAEQQRVGRFAELPPIIAAGGLKPQNVARVVRDLRPWAVDVSSGVEETLGQKSAKKLERFIKEVRESE